MSALPDTTVINLHRASRSPLTVSELEGAAWCIPDGSGSPKPLAVGAEISVGDSVAVGAGAELVVGCLRLNGGRRGQTFGLVKDGAFRPNPNRTDVPRLVLQLAQIEQQVAEGAEDPLAVRQAPETELERASSADFARTNLVLAAARELPEEVARAQRAVVLFINEETAFTAMADLSVSKLRALIEALDRPVTPHMVEESALDALLADVYAN